MIINSIEIKNFRNIENQLIELSNSKNVIYGNNGAGKTSVLEAIFFAINLTSFRSSKKSTIAHDCLYVKLTMIVDDKDKIDILYNQSLLKVFINNEPIENYEELKRFNKIIFFNPNDFNILLGPLSAKRKMLNFNIGQLDSKYLQVLKRIKVLNKEKSKIIKNVNFLELKQLNDDILKSYIEVYNLRKKYIDKINCMEQKQLKWQIQYTIPSFDLEKITKEELKFKKNKLNLDIDKLNVNVFGEDVKNFASRGQLKRIIMEICYFHKLIFEKQINENVVILIDDLHAEFDDKNIKEVLTMFENNQVLYTKIKEQEVINVSHETSKK